jgi:hypothetical protein
MRGISILSVLVLAAACTAEAPASTGFTNTPRPSRASFVEPLPPGVDPPPARELAPGPVDASGPVSPTCESGWTTPAPGTRDRAIPLRIIRDRLGVGGIPVVAELRLFKGPESPPSDKGYIQNIRRWYVVLSIPGRPGAEGRFLVEERGFGTGLVAVAPMETSGFTSPDWVGFQYDPAAPERRYPDLPGVWRGVPYDFVAGGEGITIPGLPETLVGCLDGT